MLSRAVLWQHDAAGRQPAAVVLVCLVLAAAWQVFGSVAVLVVLAVLALLVVLAVSAEAEIDDPADDVVVAPVVSELEAAVVPGIGRWLEQQSVTMAACSPGHLDGFEKPVSPSALAPTSLGPLGQPHWLDARHDVVPTKLLELPVPVSQLQIQQH